MDPRATIEAFDRFLGAHGLRFEAVIVGGAALNLLGVVERETKDCDVLEPEISPEVRNASVAFASDRRRSGVDLKDDWLNNGPSSLVPNLPAGWKKRLVPAYVGEAIELHSLGRADLLKTKLFAFCDRGIDDADCIAFAPSSEELADAQPWVEAQDTNADWPAHVRATMDELRRTLGHGA